MRAWALLLLLLPGCGYSSGFVLPDEGTTIGVEFFGNESFRPDLEAELHGYLTAALLRMVDARLVAPDQADFVITGTVTTFARRRGIRSPENVLFETGVRIGAQAQLFQRGGPESEEPLTLLYDNRFSSQSGYRLEEPRGEEDAQARVLRNLADEVVLDLFTYLSTREAP